MWTEITEVPEIINYDFVANIFDNQAYLGDLLSEQGITVAIIDYEPKSYYSYDEIYPMYKAIEQNLDKLYSKCFSAYYKNPVVHEYFEPGVADWERMIDCLNDLYSLITGEKTEWAILQCTDGIPTVLDEKYIMIRK